MKANTSIMSFLSRLVALPDVDGVGAVKIPALSISILHSILETERMYILQTKQIFLKNRHMYYNLFTIYLQVDYAL